MCKSTCAASFCAPLVNVRPAENCRLHLFSVFVILIFLRTAGGLVTIPSESLFPFLKPLLF
jgi:hypothetical protein